MNKLTFPQLKLISAAGRFQHDWQFLYSDAGLIDKDPDFPRNLVDLDPQELRAFGRGEFPEFARLERKLEKKNKKFLRDLD
jgi:hypothetical protein